MIMISCWMRGRRYFDDKGRRVNRGSDVFRACVETVYTLPEPNNVLTCFQRGIRTRVALKVHIDNLLAHQRQH